jgi:alpha-beta hydrolase superfamily lysophospholipase
MSTSIRRFCWFFPWAVAAAIAACPIAIAAPPVPGGIIARDIHFDSAGVTLAGTLVLPKGAIEAAVVLVHGSGKLTRMTPLAYGLANNGIATLTYDKRGVGESGGMYAGPEVHTDNTDPKNLALLVSDAQAALELLAREPALHGVPAGFIGISQAGWIIPIAASRASEAKFMVLWSGPVSTVHEEMLFSRITSEDPNFWEHHSREEVGKQLASTTDDIRFTDTDPRDSLMKLSIPGLWIFGGRDTSLPVDLSIKRLSELNSHGRHAFEHKYIPEAGHLMFREAFEPTVTWIKAMSRRIEDRHGVDLK